MTNDTALLIIDAQVNMFADEYPVYDRERILRVLGELIARARQARLPIVFVQNNGGEGDPDLPGSPGWQIHPALAPQAGEAVVQKHTPDAFHETGLQDELTKRGIRRIVVAGMQTDMCVDATCRRAHELGYAVTLVEDAHSTFAGGGLTAAEIIAQYNAGLGQIIQVEASNNIKFT